MNPDDKSPELAPKRQVTTNAPKPWPYAAKESRDQAAENAARIVHLLTPLVEGTPMSEAERLRKEALALIAAQTICRLLEAQGAPTRPEC